MPELGSGGSEQIQPQSTTEGSNSYLRGLRTKATLASAAAVGGGGSIGMVFESLYHDGPFKLLPFVAGIGLMAVDRALSRSNKDQIDHAIRDSRQEEPTTQSLRELRDKWISGAVGTNAGFAAGFLSGEPKLAIPAVVAALGAVAIDAGRASKIRNELKNLSPTSPSNNAGSSEEPQG